MNGFCFSMETKYDDNNDGDDDEVTYDDDYRIKKQPYLAQINKHTQHEY